MPTVLITGANRGIGLEFVRQYAREGWHVHAAARDPSAADELASIDGHVRTHRLDVGDDAMVRNLAAELAGHDIDLLVHNAGINAVSGTSLGDIDYDLWAEVFRINSMAPLRVGMAFADHVARSHRRYMVFITSRAGSIGNNIEGGRYLYRSSKAALNCVVRSLAIDLAPRRITAVAMHPGWVRTDMGGEEAPLDARTSVTEMRRTIDRLEMHHNGHFLNYDGAELDW